MLYICPTLKSDILKDEKDFPTPDEKGETSTDSVRKWLLPMVEKFFPTEGQKGRKKISYLLSPATKNDNKNKI